MSETVDSRAVPVPKLAAGKITAKIYLTWRGQLHVMKYKEDMNTPNKIEREGVVEKEH